MGTSLRPCWCLLQPFSTLLRLSRCAVVYSSQTTSSYNSIPGQNPLRKVRFDSTERSRDPMRLDFLTGREYFINFSVHLPTWVGFAEPIIMSSEEELLFTRLFGEDVRTSEDVLACVMEFATLFRRGSLHLRTLAAALGKLWNDSQVHSHYYAFDNSLNLNASIVKDDRFQLLLTSISRAVSQLSDEQLVILCLYLRWMDVDFSNECLWKTFDEAKRRCKHLDPKNLMRLLVAARDRLGMLRLGESLTAVKMHLSEASSLEDLDCLSTCVRFAFDYLTSEVRDLYAEKVAEIVESSSGADAVVLVKIATVFVEYRRNMTTAHLDAARKVLDACVGRCWELRPLDIAKLSSVVRVLGGEPRGLKAELEQAAETLLDEIWDNISIPGIYVDMDDISGPASDLLSALPADLIDKKFSEFCVTVLSSVCDLLGHEIGTPYFVKTLLWLKHWHPPPGSMGEARLQRFFTLSTALLACDPDWREVGMIVKNGSKFTRYRDPFGDSPASRFCADFESEMSSVTCDAASKYVYNRGLLTRLASIALVFPATRRPIPFHAFEVLLASVPQCTLGDLVRLMGAVKDFYRSRSSDISSHSRRQVATLRRAISIEVKRRLSDSDFWRDDLSSHQLVSLMRLVTSAEGIRPFLPRSVSTLGRVLKSKRFLDSMHSGALRDTAKFVATMRISDGDYLRTLLAKCVSQRETLGEDAVFSVLEAAFVTGFCDLPSDFTVLCEDLLVRKLSDAYPNFSSILLNSYMLSACGQISTTLLQSLFDPEKLLLIRNARIGGSRDNIHTTRLRATLAALNRVACLDYPESLVDWLPSSASAFQSADGNLHEKEGRRFVGEVGEILRVMFGSDAVLDAPQLMYGLRPPYVLQTGDGRSRVVLCVSWLEQTCEATDGSCEDPVGGAWSLSSPPRLTGEVQTRIRHLELLGYDVAVVRELEWFKVRGEGPDAVADYISRVIS